MWSDAFWYNVAYCIKTAGSYRDRREQNRSCKTMGENKPTRIKVSGLPAGVTHEYLSNFFENRRKGGGVNVLNVSINTKDSTAIVEFESPEGN